MSWRPIGTMPRDGREYLVFCPDETPQIVVAFWGFVTDHGQYLRYADDNLNEIAPNGPDATYWDEKPEPPK